MADSEENIKIRIEADSKLLARAVNESINELRKLDQANARTEQQAKRTGEALRLVKRVDPNSTLARVPTARDFQSDADRQRLREAEREAGLATERAMRREAQIDQKINARAAAARQRQAEELQTAIDRTQAERDRRTRATADLLNSQQRVRSRNEEVRNSSALDGVSPTGKQIAGAVAVSAGAIGLAAKGLEEFNRQQSASMALAGAMATRGVASDSFYEKIHKLAEEFRKNTGTKNADWLEALRGLVEHGANEGNIGELAKGVENLSAIMGGNVVHASLALQHAMEGDFQILQRWGVIVPETANQTEKLNAVLQKAAQLGAGQMEERAKSLGGQWERLKNSGNNLLATLAGTFAQSELLKQSMGGLSTIFEKAVSWIGGVVPPLEAVNSKLAISSRALTDAQNAAAKATKEFNSLEHQLERTAQMMERQARAADAIHHAQDSIANSRLELQLAQTDAAEHAGQLSPEQAAVRRAALRLQFEQGRFGRDQQATTDQQRAAEIRLNQLGTQHGLLASEARDTNSQVQQFHEAQTARAQAADDARIARLAQQRLSEAKNRPTVESIAASGGQVSVMGPAFSADEVNRRQKEFEEATARAAASRGEANRFTISTDQGAELEKRLADLMEQLRILNERIERERPGLEDAIGTARLTRDTNAAVFGDFQQRAGVELGDRLNQIGERNGGPHPQIGVEFQRQLQQQNQAWVNMFQDLLQSLGTADKERMSAVDRDIRDLASQIRMLSTRR